MLTQPWMATKYLIIHNKHEGCYDFHCYQDEVARIRLTSITINPPKIYMFSTRDEAQDFFEEYINDVDCIDIRCRRGEDVEHVDYCTCGVIELDDKGEPVLFYNKKNQIFLLEHGPQMFVPNFELKNDVKNYNLTNKLMRKCKTLAREQRKRYIELGKYCEECNVDSTSSDEEEEEAKKVKDLKDDDIPPEVKVFNAIPVEGITLEDLICKVGIDVRHGLSFCMKHSLIYKKGDLFCKTEGLMQPSNFMQPSSAGPQPTFQVQVNIPPPGTSATPTVSLTPAPNASSSASAPTTTKPKPAPRKKKDPSDPSSRKKKEAVAAAPVPNPK